MYDIPELEKKWRRYKKNQIRKPLIIGISSLILIMGVSIVVITYLKHNKKEENKVVAVKKVNQINNKQNNNQAMVVSNINNNQTANSNNSIDLSKAEIVKPNVPDMDIRVIGFDNKKEKQKIKEKYEDVLVPNKKAIEENDEVKDIEERFKDTQDPQDSLYLAKYYYKKGDYKKAESWAVATNNIDGDLEDSWLIFAKARYKQGFRVDAIKVLQSYYDETNSPKAKKLLDLFRHGKPVK